MGNPVEVVISQETYDSLVENAKPKPNFVDLIEKYAKMMNYGMSLSERNQKCDEEIIEWNEARDFNSKSKLEEEGSDIIITTVLRQIASGVNPMNALQNKIKNDLKKKGIPQCCFMCEEPMCDENGMIVWNGGTDRESVFKCGELRLEENNG